MRVHAAPAFATHHRPGQDRHGGARRAGDGPAPAVLPEAAEIGLVLLPGQVRGVVVAQEHGAVLGFAPDATAAAATRSDAPRIRGIATPGIDAGISRVAHQLPQRLAVWRPPSQLSAVRPAEGAPWQLDPLLPQVTRQPAEAPQDRESPQDQPQDLLDLLVGIELQFAVGPDDIARGGLPQPFPATAPIQPTGLHALLELVQLETPHEALDRQDHPIIEIMWMIQAVLVGEQGIEGGAHLDQTATVLVFAGQAVDLEAEDQADVAQGDLREQPGEIVAARGRGAGAALIPVEDADALGGPAPGEGPLLELSLDLGRFAVASDLLGMRLPDIVDRPAFQMVALDLGGPTRGGGINGDHRRPPFRRGRTTWGGGCRSSGSGGRREPVGGRDLTDSSRGSPRGRAGVGDEKGGVLGVGIWVAAWVAILRGSRLLLAPACQCQEGLHGDYRPCRWCDKSSCLPGRSRRASEGNRPGPSLARRAPM